MLPSLRAEALKLRRLWLPAIAAGAGLLLALLAGLSLFGAAERLRTERSLDTPWQAGVIGDVTVTMILLLPALVILLTGLACFVEHRGDMAKQLRVTPRAPLAIHAAKFVLVQALLAFALLAALAASCIGWHFLPAPLRAQIGVADGRVYADLARLAGLLFLSLLPVSLVQYLLSARLPNILHGVGLGLGLAVASLMLFGPATALYLPYAWPGAVTMAAFPIETESQQPDTAYQPPAAAFAGARAGHGAILFDDAHGNRHVAGTREAPGSLAWIAAAARASRIEVRQGAARALAGVDLLVVGGASTPLRPDEADAVVAWVRRGGSLLLLTDHEPFASASRGLAARFGAAVSLAMMEGDAPGSSRRTVAAARTPSGEAVGPVRTYGGVAVSRGGGRQMLAQAVAFDFGRGRVVVAGDGGLFGAQRNAHGAVGVNDGETRNQAFVVATLRWLLRFG